MCKLCLLLSQASLEYSDKYSRLWRCSTAKGSSTRLSLVGLTKVQACKSFLFTEGSLKVEDKEYLVDFVVTLYSTQLNFLCTLLAILSILTPCHINTSRRLNGKNLTTKCMWQNLLLQSRTWHGSEA